MSPVAGYACRRESPVLTCWCAVDGSGVVTSIACEVKFFFSDTSKLWFGTFILKGVSFKTTTQLPHDRERHPASLQQLCINFETLRVAATGTRTPARIRERPRTNTRCWFSDRARHHSWRHNENETGERAVFSHHCLSSTDAFCSSLCVSADTGAPGVIRVVASDFSNSIVNRRFHGGEAAISLAADS